MSNPFEYVNQILQGKKNLIIDENTEKEYNPFLTNRSLSYHFDTVLFANEMNRRSHLDKKMQNDFLINTVRSKKRPFVKWVKPEENENLECIKKFYDCSSSKSLEILRLLNHEQIQQLKEQTDLGGLRK
jgi:hypothetical protein